MTNSPTPENTLARDQVFAGDSDNFPYVLGKIHALELEIDSIKSRLDRHENLIERLVGLLETMIPIKL